ncbi:MAG: Mrp/NBP35 family ATP-binding protein [Treponema sp.]|nr:Mrp/NBP35 family ATP-binding protein [Candidatus Treponema equifaecale]
MAENCTHNCSTCSSNCKSKDLRVQLRESSCVKKVIGIVSGKGGVGKSLVTALMAAKLSQRGFKTAVLDADITGPSIPTSFGVAEEKAMGDASGAIYPVTTKSGIQLMSMNFLLEHETDPVLWRGPVIAGAVKQFWTDVVWKDVDFMFVDMPPGTGDVPLTVFQSLPVDGIIIVSSPQQLVRVIVEKAVKMAEMMKIPVLGLVENMSYVQCPDCDRQIKIFGESNVEKIALDYGIPLLAKIPISEEMSRAIDEGEVESLKSDFLDAAADRVTQI